MKRPLLSPGGPFDLAEAGEETEREPIAPDEAVRIVRELARDPWNLAVLRRIDTVDRIVRDLATKRLSLYRTVQGSTPEED